MKRSTGISVIQTFGDRINLHPHIYVLITEGGTAPDGAFHLLCPSCGSKMSIISFIEEPKTIGRIIGHLELTFEADHHRPIMSSRNS